MRSVLALAALLLAPLTGIAPGGVAAAQTYTVTVQPKTSAHPYSGQGNGNGFAINDVEGAELTLVRGQTYTFQMSGVPSSHPFYLSTTSGGGGGGVWTDGVTGNGATGNATVTFTVPASAPDLLWYQCQNHSFMGWRLTIAGATDVEDETPRATFDLETANPSSGGARFTLVPVESGQATVEVFAADGRRVAVLLDRAVGAGQAQTVRMPRLASGVYVVRAASGDWRAERAVTIAR